MATWHLHVLYTVDNYSMYHSSSIDVDPMVSGLRSATVYTSASPSAGYVVAYQALSHVSRHPNHEVLERLSRKRLNSPNHWLGVWQPSSLVCRQQQQQHRMLCSCFIMMMMMLNIQCQVDHHQGQVGASKHLIVPVLGT